jgi:hypothetical protein
MTLKSKLFLIMGLIAVGVMVAPVEALAVPHFTLTPASESETVGQNFDVIMGVDSDTDKVVGMDIVATFDAARLEIVDVQKGSIPEGETYYQFDYTASLPKFDNTAGTFSINLSPRSSSIYEGPVAKQELLKITFRPKATGVATVNYTCQANSLLESNIIQASTVVDVVDCTANQSGSYTIAAGTGGESEAVTPTPTTTTTTTTSTSQLPRTGGIMDTIVMIVIGISSMFAAAYLKRI